MADMADEDTLTSTCAANCTANLHGLRLRHAGGKSQLEQRKGKQLSQMLRILLIQTELTLVAVTAQVPIPNSMSLPGSHQMGPRYVPAMGSSPDMTASYVGMQILFNLQMQVLTFMACSTAETVASQLE